MHKVWPNGCTKGYLQKAEKISENETKWEPTILRLSHLCPVKANCNEWRFYTAWTRISLREVVKLKVCIKEKIIPYIWCLNSEDAPLFLFFLSISPWYGDEIRWANFFFFLIIARHSVFWCFLFHSSTINIVIDLYLHHHKVFRVTSILCKSMFCSQNQNKILATDRPSQFLMWRKVEENGKVKHLKNKCLI